jgi:hypothetical protein
MQSESNQNTPRSYALALLTLVASQPDARDNPLFGFAIRQVKRASLYCQTAHEFLQALIEYSPSPETVTEQFLLELAGCGNTAVETLGDAFSTLCDLFYVKHYSMRKSPI